MRNFGKLLLAGASPFVLLLTGTSAFAQSTGTQEIETVTVTAEVTNKNGLMNAKPVSKQQSVVTSEFLQTQSAGQTVFQALNFMPGVNFTNVAVRILDHVGCLGQRPGEAGGVGHIIDCAARSGC